MPSICLFSCWKSEPRQQHHSHFNDIVWHAIKKVQIPAVKKPVGLLRQEGKRLKRHHDPAVVKGRAAGKAWHGTSQYADAHVSNIATKIRAADSHGTTN